MNLFYGLLVLLSFLFFNVAAQAKDVDLYNAISLSDNHLNLQVFEVEDHKFIYPKDLCVNTLCINTRFNSLNDFRVDVINESIYKLRSWKLPIAYKHVGFGVFDIRHLQEFVHGELVIGKSLSEKTIEKLKCFSGLHFEGNSIDSESTILFSLTLNPLTGMIQGRVGEFYVESLPTSFNGTCEAIIYSIDAEERKKLEGKLLLNVYGEENFVLAGGYVLFGQESNLIYLKMKE